LSDAFDLLPIKSAPLLKKAGDDIDFIQIIKMFLQPALIDGFNRADGDRLAVNFICKMA
jgi:hypothetical protein